MYALFTQHNDKYQDLADLTWEQNKVIYAKKHGYDYHAKTDEFKTGFDKMYMAKDLLENNSHYEWLWWTGTDSMITNMNVRIEDRIMNQYHLIVSTDVNGLNADSFLIRNSPEGRAIVDDVLSLEQECLPYWDTEQRAFCIVLGIPFGGIPVDGNPGWPPPGIINMNSKYADIVKIVPQKYLNSYNYQFYREHIDHRDKTGVDGNWSYGDWLIHWPALSKEHRIQCFNAYAPFVVR